MARPLTRSTFGALALIALSAASGAALAQAPGKNAAKPAAASQAQSSQAPGPTLLPGASSHEPINIAADKLDYFDKEQKLVYSGNVVAVQGESRLNASVLTILLDKKPAGGAAPAPAGPGASGSQVRRMEGKGPIAITNKDQVGTGDGLVYDKIENKFYLIGHVALSQGENVTRGDKLVYDLTTGQAVVSSAGRVRSLIVPGDQNAKPGSPQTATPQPAAKPAAKPAPQNKRVP
jgi:lipopolysaccharide export system protein LptA